MEGGGGVEVVHICGWFLTTFLQKLFGVDIFFEGYNRQVRGYDNHPPFDRLPFAALKYLLRKCLIYRIPLIYEESLASKRKLFLG